MNKTSRSSRLVSNAARSPAFAITGPDVARKLTPSSRATIWASVVLPRPGGPTNSTWSSASPRPRAAAMNTSRFARAWACPMNSENRCGRSDASAASSSRRSGVTRRRGVLIQTHSSRELLEPEADERRSAGALAGALGRRRNRGRRLRLTITKIDQGRDGVEHRLRGAQIVELRGQRLEGAGRAMHHVTDAADVDDDEVLAVAVDDAFELADHCAATLRRTLCRWCAWVTAIASASAASSFSGTAFGSSTPIIMRICALSQWPAPTMVFFTRLGAYSATMIPAW